jgi:acetyl-CoA decarbonylase/synthase, CODH/ACS complex subunit delta
MPFADKPQVFSATLKTLTFGKEGKTVSLGGGNVYPLYSFDGTTSQAKVGIEVSDKGFDATVPGLAAFYAGCETVVDRAKKAATAEGVDFVALVLESADPNGENASVDDCAATAKAVCDAIDKPLVVMGCKNMEKDTELFVKVSDVLRGENALFLSCKEENYKTVGASVVLAGGQNVGGESAVDINLAKQLNVLLSQMGIPMDKVVMNLGQAAAGYGFEYLASTVERVKDAALKQNDAALQMPVITPLASDCWGVKEAILEEADAPDWGSREERGIQMEITTASAVIASGSDAVILRHPESVKTISELVSALA